MSTALITGITGQDGSYLAELLVMKGYRVIGAVRNVHSAKQSLPVGLRNSVELIVWDMLDQHRMMEVLSEYNPTEVYNFAACSSGIAMYDDPIEVGEVNGLAVTRILEAIRGVDDKIRFCQASSREIFGEANESPQTESTTRNPRSPYGAAKLYADTMIQIYRQKYNIFACSAILYNHESPRRGLDFVTRKIIHEAVKIKLGFASELHLGNLEAQRDWGFSGDYVRAMWLMLQHEGAADYVIATGVVHSVRELCEYSFSRLGLDYRNYVREDKSVYRPAETSILVGCADKARIELGWQPEVAFREMIDMMVDTDLQNLSRNI